ELGDPGREGETSGLADRPRGHSRLQAAVELIGVGKRRLRHDHGELVAADATGDVGRAYDVPDALRGVGEHGVAGQMPDPVVDRLEVVEVEDDQRELSVVAVRTGDLATECLVEVAPVVESGQGVEISELARLAEPLRVLDRGPGSK